MNGGDTTTVHQNEYVDIEISKQLSTSSLSSDEEQQISEKKDPRKMARKYQMDLCKKALEENVIVYMGTGCGKTHIAVLLIYEMGHLIKKPQKNICIFLAPTVALVQQLKFETFSEFPFLRLMKCYPNPSLSTAFDQPSRCHLVDVMSYHSPLFDAPN
ncbi:hypothetical protein BUALT_Bualt12G0086800 [Buddleja alternifolia]|uniref:DEAD/DEAH-box helicase domain-containing protein n=1 Tax=Buddleja alternifolia TaxID=168488 RepID=A0AAV6WY75_9LAMI|nr:hypothetical protein BUALT_Bualt12G0086800 [Buddleja alternifolia]